jgi:putative FmdB family regulatory protein
MILYTYKCETCGEFEAMGRLEDSRVDCSCGAYASRLISGAPAVRLLGCGWSVDNYGCVSHPRFGAKSDGTEREGY